MADRQGAAAGHRHRRRRQASGRAGTPRSIRSARRWVSRVPRPCAARPSSIARRWRRSASRATAWRSSRARRPSSPRRSSSPPASPARCLPHSRDTSWRQKPTSRSRRRSGPTCGARPARATRLSRIDRARRIGCAGPPTIASSGRAPISLASTRRQRKAVLIQRTGQLMYELSLALPAISGTRPEYGWHAPWSRAHDDLPFIGTHRNYPHHLFALGLGTNLTAAFLASRILVRAVQGDEREVRRLLRLRAFGGQAVNRTSGSDRTARSARCTRTSTVH